MTEQNLRPPRIAVLTTSFPRSRDDDASIFIARLVDALTEVGASGVVVVPRDRNEPPNEQRGSFQIRRYRYGLFIRGSLAFGSGIMPNLRRHPWLILQAPALIGLMAWQAIRCAKAVDIFSAQWAASGIAAWLASRITRKPYAVSLLGEDAKLLRSPLLKPLFRRVLADARAVTAVSQDFLGELTTLFPEISEKRYFVPTGVSSTLPSQESAASTLNKYGVAPSERYLLAVARVIPLKGVSLLIRILAALRATFGYSELSLLVAGALDEKPHVEELLALATQLNVATQVRFLGRVPPTDIPALLSTSTAFLSGSQYEGRPNAVMEALALGVLTCVSDIPAHRTLVEHLDSGILFPLEDADAAAKEIAGALSNPELKLRLTERGKASLSEESWTAAARRLISALNASR